VIIKYPCRSLAVDILFKDQYLLVEIADYRSNINPLSLIPSVRRGMRSALAMVHIVARLLVVTKHSLLQRSVMLTSGDRTFLAMVARRLLL
jgi:hypothetical protein